MKINHDNSPNLSRYKYFENLRDIELLAASDLAVVFGFMTWLQTYFDDGLMNVQMTH